MTDDNKNREFDGIMFENGLPWIDCQVYTDHLARFVAKNIPRSEYLLLLEETLKKADDKS